MREGLINSHKYRMRREENGGLVAKRKMAYFQISPTGDRLSLTKLRCIRMYCECKILSKYCRNDQGQVYYMIPNIHKTQCQLYKRLAGPFILLSWFLCGLKKSFKKNISVRFQWLWGSINPSGQNGSREKRGRLCELLDLKWVVWRF